MFCKTEYKFQFSQNKHVCQSILTRIWGYGFILTRLGSSVSIMSDYRLDGQGLIPSRDKGISSSLCVQTRSEVHPAYHPVGTESGFDAEGRPRRFYYKDWVIFERHRVITQLLSVHSKQSLICLMRTSYGMISIKSKKAVPLHTEALEGEEV
jgi:hypothetical protein